MIVLFLMTVYRQIVSVLVAVYFIIQPALPYLEYYAFKEYIAENLCIKKDVPDSCCKGKCYLEKKLKKNNEQEEQGEVPPLKVQKENLIVDLPPIEHLLQNETIVLEHKVYYICTYTWTLAARLFHPPESV